MHVAIRTITNGWPTKARFGFNRPCIYCGEMDVCNGVRDNVEHYRSCPAVCLLLSSLLCNPSLAPMHVGPRSFYCVGLPDQTALVRHVFWLDVLYSIFCTLRFEGATPTNVRLSSLARARLRQAASTNPRARQFIATHFRFPHTKARATHGDLIHKSIHDGNSAHGDLGRHHNSNG